jgi:hypothetical protein
MPDRDSTLDGYRQQRSLDFVRLLACQAQGGSVAAIAERFASVYPTSVSVDVITRAATSIGTSTDATWAGPLVGTEALAREFAGFVYGSTLIGRLQDLVRVPFNTKIPVQSAAASFAWVGEGVSKPVTTFGFTSETLPVRKCQGTVVVTAELLQPRPGLALALRRQLATELRRFLDREFIDPAVSEVVGISPPSITNDVTPIASTGNASDDYKALVQAFTAANPYSERPALLLSPANAVIFTQAMPGFGSSAIGPKVLTSSVLGSNLVMLDESAIAVAGADEIVLDVSRQGLVQMDSAPATPPTGGMVSLWQQNLAGIRTEASANWIKLRPEAVAFVSGATYPTP